MKRAIAPLLLAWALACAGAAPAPDDLASGAAESAPLDLSRLERLAGDFYRRLENRRFNSIATFQDPGLHEFFRSRESYSDYYAELAHALELSNFEASRPTRVEVQEYTQDAALRVRVRVRFVGENGLPLRWWSIELLREDIWELGAEGRWWIVPGKV